MNFNEFLNEKNVNEAFEVHYSDGVRAFKKFNNQKQAIDFAKDLIKNKKSLQFVDVFNAGSGFHSTADTNAIVAFWGDGSYTDNVAKKDPKLAAKKIEESIESEEVSEASKFGAPAGLTKAETKKVAETLAKAMSKAEGAKVTVNLKTLEEDSFDLDYDGEEYDGGSYNIYDDGSVVNHAVTPNEIYGKSHSSVEDFIKGLKKPIKESVEINEAAVKQFEKDFDKMVKDIKSGYGWIDPEYVEETWENSSDSIDFDLVKAEIYNRLIKAGLLWHADENDGEEKGKQVKSLKELGIKESVVTESRITLKRQYTENYPAKTVGKHAAIRNKIIEALKDGELTKEDFDQLISGLTEDSKRWLRRNAQFFNVGEEKVALSATGKKILKSIDEAGYRPMSDEERSKKQYKDQQLKKLQDLKKKEDEGKRLKALQQKLHQAKLKKANENNDTNMENKFIYESFAEFVESKLNEDNEFLVESFKSSILAGFIDLKFAPKELYKAFYNYTKVALDQIEDADFTEMDPNTAYKSKDLGESIVFYVSRNEKENPFAPEDAYYTNKTIPSNALLAIANGQNDFFGVAWAGRYGKGQYGLSNRGNDGNKADTAGIGKKYRSWDATGLSNVKRISEVSDVAYVLPLELVRQKYSTEGIRAARAAAQAGATALKDAKSFKEANIARYKSILASRIMNDDLDGKVEKAILKCSDLISKAVQAKEFTRYGEMKLGNAPDGREVTLRDATQYMNNLMSDYTDYARSKNEAKQEEEKYGKADSYYEKQAKQKAISIKERLAKLDNLNIVW